MQSLLGYVIVAILVLVALVSLAWIVLALLAQMLTPVVLYWAGTALLGFVAGAGTGLLVPFLILTGRGRIEPLQLRPEDVAAGRVAGRKPGGPNREHGWDRAWPNYLPHQARHDAAAITRELRSRASWCAALLPRGASNRAKSGRGGAERTGTSTPKAASPGKDRPGGTRSGVPGPGAAQVGAAGNGKTQPAPAGSAGQRIGQLAWFLLRALMLLPGGLAFLLGLWGTAFLWFAVMGVIGALARCVQALLICVTWLGQHARLRRGRVSASCPRCHARTTLPGFRCDGGGCGVVHWTLRPGPLGVLTRRCECGTRLPGSAVAAARRLRPVCPYCESELPAGSGGRQSLQIGVIGSVGSGKSRLLAAMLDDAARFAGSRGGRLRPLAEPAARFLAGAAELREQRSPTMKTAHETPAGLPFLIESDGSCAEVQLVDAAGESFSSWQETEPLRYLDEARTLVFALDPLALPGVRARFERSAGSVPLAEGVQEDAYAAAVDRMRADRLPFAGKRLAVVLTKADVLTALPGCTHLAGAQDEAISEWLSSAGEDLLVRRLRKDFREVRFFLTDSMDIRDPEDPASPLAVLRWILDGAHAGVVAPAARDSHATVPAQEDAASGAGAAQAAGDGSAQERENAPAEEETAGNTDRETDEDTAGNARAASDRNAQEHENAPDEETDEDATGKTDGDVRAAGDGSGRGREDVLAEGETAGDSEGAGGPGVRIPAAYVAHRRAWLALHTVVTLCCAAALLGWFMTSDVPRQFAEDGMSWLAEVQDRFSRLVPLPWDGSRS